MFLPPVEKPGPFCGGFCFEGFISSSRRSPFVCCILRMAHTHTHTLCIGRECEGLESGQKSKSKADMASMVRRFVVHGECLLQLFANVLKHHVVKLDYQRLAQAMGDSSSLSPHLIHSINSVHRRDTKSNIPPNRQDQRKGSSTPQ